MGLELGGNYLASVASVVTLQKIDYNIFNLKKQQKPMQDLKKYQ